MALPPMSKATKVSLADLVDRHLGTQREHCPALRWCGRDGRRRDFSFAELAALSDLLAVRLRQGGVVPGAVVAVMTGRQPETVIAALAIWKLSAVFCPLYADLGPDPLRARLLAAEARFLLIAEEPYRNSLSPLLGHLPDLAKIWYLGAELPDNCQSLAQALTGPDTALPPQDPSQAGVLHFTSGTTARLSAGAGLPRAIRHCSRLEEYLLEGAEAAFALRPGELIWCTGEPGWAVFSAFGIIVPLAVGATILLDEAAPSPTRCLTLLEQEPVDVWYTTPTVIRRLIGAGTAIARSADKIRLRLAASVGEPLSADAVRWGERALGLAFRDSWWQTETGGIVLAQPHGTAPCAGSMGRPVGGVTLRLARRDGDQIAFLPDVGEASGEIAIRIADLAPFQSIGGELDALTEDIAGWHFTHDLARRDAAGNYWFLGRSDDLVNIEGRMVGPFEIEAALMGHPAVAEIGVVGHSGPDHVTSLVAFIALNPGFHPMPALKAELQLFAIEHLGPVLAPSDMRFEASLPRTSSGKIIRSQLRLKL